MGSVQATWRDAIPKKVKTEISPETDSHIHKNLIMIKGSISNQRQRNQIFNKCFEENWIAIWKNPIYGTKLIPYTRSDYKKIKDPSVKKKANVT